MLSSSTAASGGGGFTGFLSSLARTVSSASSSSQNNSQNKSVSPNTTFSAGVGDKSISDYDPAREPIKVSLSLGRTTHGNMTLICVF